MKVFKSNQFKMGSAFELGVVADSKEGANRYFKLAWTEIDRLEALWSEYKPTSTISQINNQVAFKTLQNIDTETYELIRRAKALSKLTNCAFDITTKNLKQLYSFKNSSFAMPQADKIKEALSQTGSYHLKLIRNKQGIRKDKDGLQISLAGIGKGTAADFAIKIWRQHGLASGYVNCSGDLTTMGVRPNGSSWNIAIKNPSQENENLFYIPLENKAIATSGDYEQYFIHNGERYGHTINPKTGMPCKQIKSVSVISPSAELSDALATALTVMGPAIGIDFVDRLPETHAIFVLPDNQIFTSKKIAYQTV